MLIDGASIEDIVSWAIDSFEPYRYAGLDGIIPKMLHISKESIIPIFIKLYIDCLKLTYIPDSWRKFVVVFILKPGKIGHSTIKDFRPISLTSILLKTLERLLDIRRKYIPP